MGYSNDILMDFPPYKKLGIPKDLSFQSSPKRKTLGTDKEAAASFWTPCPRGSGSKTKVETAAAEPAAEGVKQKRRLPAKDVWKISLKDFYRDATVLRHVLEKHRTMRCNNSMT